MQLPLITTLGCGAVHLQGNLVGINRGRKRKVSRGDEYLCEAAAAAPVNLNERGNLECSKLHVNERETAHWSNQLGLSACGHGQGH